jgi:hypothetical protein
LPFTCLCALVLQKQLRTRLLASCRTRMSPWSWSHPSPNTCVDVVKDCDYRIFFSSTLIVCLRVVCCRQMRHLCGCGCPSTHTWHGRAGLFLCGTVATVSCTATLPPTCKTTQCTWVLADRIAMDSWPCSMATTDALSRDTTVIVRPLAVRKHKSDLANYIRAFVNIRFVK